MKKFFILLSILIFCKIAKSQEFTFHMYFQDAIGNKDTLTLGYDLNATDSIDPAFGEINIISNPIDTAFDVRVTNEWLNRYFWGTPGNYHTKKQIVKNNCGNLSFSKSTIDIYTKHWPVTASWDSVPFYDICRNGSVFTQIHPSLWWDCFSGQSDFFRVTLISKSHLTFTSNVGNGFDPNGGYINESGDTISVFWLAIGDSILLSESINEVENSFPIKIYPNPVTDRIIIENETTNKITQVQLFDFSGQKVSLTMNNNEINVSQLDNGIYFIQLLFSSGQIQNRKIIKISSR